MAATDDPLRDVEAAVPAEMENERLSFSAHGSIDLSNENSVISARAEDVQGGAIKMYIAYRKA